MGTTSSNTHLRALHTLFSQTKFEAGDDDNRTTTPNPSVIGLTSEDETLLPQFVQAAHSHVCVSYFEAWLAG